MAKRQRAGSVRGGALRQVLLAAGFLLSAVSALLYMHALGDGDVGFWESLRPGAAAADPLAVVWIPVLAGALVGVGALTRLRLAWLGLSILAIFGAFFFSGVGWAYLLAAALLAALAGQIPPRRPILARK